MKFRIRWKIASVKNKVTWQYFLYLLDAYRYFESSIRVCFWRLRMFNRYRSCNAGNCLKHLAFIIIIHVSIRIILKIDSMVRIVFEYSLKANCFINFNLIFLTSTWLTYLHILNFVTRIRFSHSGRIEYQGISYDPSKTIFRKRY